MKIVMVDDHPLIRQGIAAVLALQTDMTLVAEASNSEDALECIEENQPDIVIIDLKLGQQSGLEIIRKSQEQNNKCKFIVLTSSADQDDFRQVSEVGVDGYVLKEALPEELLAALRIVYRGRKYYDPGLLELMMHDNEDDPVEQLTPREREVLAALGKGLNNKDIAKTLYITEYTVKKHVSQILAKLDLADRTQAAIYINQKRA